MQTCSIKKYVLKLANIQLAAVLVKPKSRIWFTLWYLKLRYFATAHLIGLCHQIPVQQEIMHND